MQVFSPPRVPPTRGLQPRNPLRRRVRGLALFAAIAVTNILSAQVPILTRAGANTPEPSPTAVDPRLWATQCAAHEAAVIAHPNSFLRYRMHVVDEKGDQVRDVLETPDGSVARLILRDNRPLSPEEDAAERDRLTALLNTPSAFARHIKSEQSNRKMGLDLLKLFPDAMLWTYAPGQPRPPGSSATGSPALVVLDFTPNPAWNAPSIPAEALTGLAGRVWIEPGTQQLVHIEGSLIKPVNIGWGVVAHLYPGATVAINQTRVSPDRWIADHVLEQLNLRALMVKSIRQRLVYDTSSYQPIPSMPYQQAIKLLLDTPLPSH